jgi:hypothetical protein
MKNPIVIVSIASIVALSIAAIAFAASGDGSRPDSEAPGLGGGAASGACPAIDFPGISDEERERCYGLDSPGGGAASPDSPVTNDPSSPLTPADNELPALPDDRRTEPAPIEGLEVLTLESFPPQYVLHVQAGLPSGCAERYGNEVVRAGDVITVTVLNTMPADANVACTMIYGIYDFNLGLGSDFESGVTYTVAVNGQEIDFTAQ